MEVLRSLGDGRGVCGETCKLEVEEAIESILNDGGSGTKSLDRRALGILDFLAKRQTKEHCGQCKKKVPSVETMRRLEIGFLKVLHDDDKDSAELGG